MRNTTKRLLCLVLMVILLLSVAGCSGSADIVGIWEQEMEISILGIEGTGSAMSVARFTFREDGTGIQEHIVADGSYPNAVREFHWQLEGDTLTLVYAENQTEEIFPTARL